LPVSDPSRTEFGFARTLCACPSCILNCRHIPGYLIPADLDRIQKHLGSEKEGFAWAKKYLLASPGAVVLRAGRLFRIPTLVPARSSQGACTFLTADDRCAIHAMAPFGCAFFDEHMDAKEANRRSACGLQAILAAWKSEDLYAQVWRALDQAGLQAPAPEMCRRRLHAGGEGTEPQLS
jgi:hypothetical protein